MNAKLLLNLGNLKHNYLYAKSLTRNQKLFAVIKDNAYGFGVRQVVECLNGVADGFAVAVIDEFLPLKELKIEGDILLLMGVFSTKDLKIAIDNNLIITIATLEQVQMLLNSRQDKNVRVFLKIDSGMSRLGLSEAEAISAYTQFKHRQNITEITLMSHFCCADNDLEKTQKQIQYFNKIKNTLNIKTTSLSNSAGILNRYYQQTYARLGVALYGSNPIKNNHNIKTVSTLLAPIISIKTIKKGDSIGYGAIYICSKDSKIAVVKIGYGDGYPRNISSGTYAFVAGVKVLIVGRVSMDMITIDVTGVHCKVGDDVELFGKHININSVATSASTISYEVFCSMNVRIPRVFK